MFLGPILAAAIATAAAAAQPEQLDAAASRRQFSLNQHSFVLKSGSSLTQQSHLRLPTFAVDHRIRSPDRLADSESIQGKNGSDASAKSKSPPSAVKLRC